MPDPTAELRAGEKLRDALTRAAPACPSCGYSLAGAEHTACPECGAVVPMPDGQVTLSDAAKRALEARLASLDVRCAACGYQLKGNTSDHCPECGILSPIGAARRERTPTPSDGPGMAAWRIGASILVILSTFAFPLAMVNALSGRGRPLTAASLPIAVLTLMPLWVLIGWRVWRSAVRESPNAAWIAAAAVTFALLGVVGGTVITR